MGSAQEKALGLIGASSALDGWVGIASDAELQLLDGTSWNFSPTATPTATEYYLVGVIEHEFTEVMGRYSYLDTRGEYGVIDLYRYAAPGVRQTGTGDPAYFSIDGGVTNLDSFNNPHAAAGDLSDWAPNAGPSGVFQYAGADAFNNNSLPGQINSLTATDLTLMGALGWIDNTSPNEPQSTLPVAIGGTATISHAFLWSYDPDNTAAELTYTVDTAPTHGTILLNGAATTNFTQADLDNNRVQYREDGDVANGDGFTFTVSDPAGNRIGPEPYTIAIVNTTAPVIEANATLTASVGSSSMIWKNSLCAVALGSEPTDLRYSVLIGPAHGMLLVDGASTDTFTQAEIDDHRVQYQNNGDAVTGDSFTFQATDATGDQTPVTTFNIAIQSAPLARPDAGWAALSDGNHTTDLALLGQYAAAGFATSPDQGAGAMVTSMPPQDGTGAPTLLTIPQYSTV